MCVSERASECVRVNIVAYSCKEYHGMFIGNFVKLMRWIEWRGRKARVCLHVWVWVSNTGYIHIHRLVCICYFPLSFLSLLVKTKKKNKCKTTTTFFETKNVFFFLSLTILNSLLGNSGANDKQWIFNKVCDSRFWAIANFGRKSVQHMLDGECTREKFMLLQTLVDLRCYEKTATTAAAAAAVAAIFLIALQSWKTHPENLSSKIAAVSLMNYTNTDTDTNAI